MKAWKGILKVLGSPSKNRGPLFWSSEQMSSLELCVPSAPWCAFLVKPVEKPAGLWMDGRGDILNCVIFYFSSAVEGALAEFYISSSCLLNPKVI